MRKNLDSDYLLKKQVQNNSIKETYLKFKESNKCLSNNNTSSQIIETNIKKSKNNFEENKDNEFLGKKRNYPNNLINKKLPHSLDKIENNEINEKTSKKPSSIYNYTASINKDIQKSKLECEQNIEDIFKNNIISLDENEETLSQIEQGINEDNFYQKEFQLRNKMLHEHYKKKEEIWSKYVIEFFQNKNNFKNFQVKRQDEMTIKCCIKKVQPLNINNINNNNQNNTILNKSFNNENNKANNDKLNDVNNLNNQGKDKDSSSLAPDNKQNNTTNNGIFNKINTNNVNNDNNNINTNGSNKSSLFGNLNKTDNNSSSLNFMTNSNDQNKETNHNSEKEGKGLFGAFAKSDSNGLFGKAKDNQAEDSSSFFDNHSDDGKLINNSNNKPPGLLNQESNISQNISRKNIFVSNETNKDDKSKNNDSKSNSLFSINKEQTENKFLFGSPSKQSSIETKALNLFGDDKNQKLFDDKKESGGLFDKNIDSQKTKESSLFNSKNSCIFDNKNTNQGLFSTNTSNGNSNNQGLFSQIKGTNDNNLFTNSNTNNTNNSNTTNSFLSSNFNSNNNALNLENSNQNFSDKSGNLNNNNNPFIQCITSNTQSNIPNVFTSPTEKKELFNINFNNFNKPNNNETNNNSQSSVYNPFLNTQVYTNNSNNNANNNFNNFNVFNSKTSFNGSINFNSSPQSASSANPFLMCPSPKDSGQSLFSSNTPKKKNSNFFYN